MKYKLALVAILVFAALGAFLMWGVPTLTERMLIPSCETLDTQARSPQHRIEPSQMMNRVNAEPLHPYRGPATRCLDNRTTVTATTGFEMQYADKDWAYVVYPENGSTTHAWFRRTDFVEAPPVDVVPDAAAKDVVSD